MRRGKYLLIVMLAFATTGRVCASDTVAVYFPFNKSLITETARQQLDVAIYKGIIGDSQPIQIIGYTDEVGGDHYNLRLSRQRAENVKAYLLQSGFRNELITLIAGKGEAGAHAAAGPDGNPPDRRVDIVKGGPPPQRESPKPAAVSMAKATIPRKASVTDISTVAEGETLVLDKIYFYPGRHVVRRESDEALEALVSSLQANTNVRISIEGHVCCIHNSTVDAMDDDTHRIDLSVNRARTIRDYLVAHGIAADRLRYTGFGHQRPIVAVERNEEEADLNRRVEIRVIK